MRASMALAISLVMRIARRIAALFSNQSMVHSIICSGLTKYGCTVLQEHLHLYLKIFPAQYHNMMPTRI
jgi:hypothetical protein